VLPSATPDRGTSMMGRMTQAYLETRFRTPRPVTDWPRVFVVISACATTGEVWPPERNEAADRALEASLRVCGGWLRRIVGYSPDSGHAEPSWAVDVSVEEGRALGRRFLQDAIFHVEADDLSVVHCEGPGAFVVIGSFRDRLDSEGDKGAVDGQG
jgi:hypothetical protein